MRFALVVNIFVAVATLAMAVFLTTAVYAGDAVSLANDTSPGTVYSVDAERGSGDGAVVIFGGEGDAGNVGLEAWEVALNAGDSAWSGETELGARGEAFVLVEAMARGASWADADAKSIVLKLFVDGEWRSDIVVFGGDEYLTYSACAGRLDAGTHSFRLEFDEGSPAPNATALIRKIALDVVGAGDAKYLAHKHSPLIYLLDGRADNDVPMLLFYNTWEDEKSVSIRYQTLFSNEDGGTGGILEVLMAEYGRVTDIEWTYYLTIDKTSGEIVNEFYQAQGHKTRAFTGAKEGAHPILRVSEDNGNFDEEGATNVRVGLVPLLFKHSGKPRETIMDAYPWTHRVMNEEMFSEGKAESPGLAETSRMSDARNYLYLDYYVKNNNGEKSLEFEVRLKGNKYVYSSKPRIEIMFLGDLGLLSSSGRRRTAIELPPGSSAEMIEAIRARGNAAVDYNIYEVNAFFLDRAFVPQPYFFSFKGDVRLTKERRKAFLPKETRRKNE